MSQFHGFPPGMKNMVYLPELFFSELLPQIDDLTELKVTLYCFWAVQVQEGEHRYIRFSEVLRDEKFTLDEKTLKFGFEKAVRRGTLLKQSIQLSTGEDEFYFINGVKGRNTLKALQEGTWQPDPEMRPLQMQNERPTIYKLYEANIGMLNPMIADHLKDAEATYPYEWIVEAIDIAVQRQARNWKYVSAILERWRSEGHKEGNPKKVPEQAKYTISDQYSNLFEK